MSDNYPRPDPYNWPEQPAPVIQDYRNLPPLPQAPAEPEPTPPPAKPKINWFRVLARYAAIWLAILLIVKFVVPSYEVKGSSMVPTYQPAGDRVLTDGVFFK